MSLLFSPLAKFLPLGPTYQQYNNIVIYHCNHQAAYSNITQFHCILPISFFRERVYIVVRNERMRKNKMIYWTAGYVTMLFNVRHRVVPTMRVWCYLSPVQSWSCVTTHLRQHLRHRPLKPIIIDLQLTACRLCHCTTNCSRRTLPGVFPMWDVHCNTSSMTATPLVCSCFRPVISWRAVYQVVGEIERSFRYCSSRSDLVTSISYQ